MFFRNYPQSLKKDSSRISVHEHLQGLEKYVVNWFSILTYLPKNCLLQVAVFSESKVLLPISERKALSRWTLYVSLREIIPF